MAKKDPAVATFLLRLILVPKVIRTSEIRGATEKNGALVLNPLVDIWTRKTMNPYMTIICHRLRINIFLNFLRSKPDMEINLLRSD